MNSMDSSKEMNGSTMELIPAILERLEGLESRFDNPIEDDPGNLLGSISANFQALNMLRAIKDERLAQEVSDFCLKVAGEPEAVVMEEVRDLYKRVVASLSANK